MWNKISLAYRNKKCFTDFYSVYKNSIPKDQSYPVGKETGETAHVERWNTTLRQRLDRFVIGTLYFSKYDAMHEICLHLFLHRYNKEKALAFM
jgi:insertion element IS1 protein InsB